jgi:hypothetical protein
MSIIFYVVGREGEDCYYDLRRFLLKQTYFKRITFLDKGDIFRTGRFEVSIKEAKEMIHSKKGGMAWSKSEEAK